jgi:transcriptional regulator with XRE-family HTH domain
MTQTSQAIPEASSGTEPSRLLAARIRALRDERGWTLDVTSEHTGLSRSALSKIERHEMSPTFNVLNKLAAGFGISMIQLMEGSAPAKSDDILFTPRGEGSIYSTSLYDIRFLKAALFPNSPLVVTEFTVEADDIKMLEQWDRHDDENFVYVLDGPMLFHSETRDGPMRLETGDSICFDARTGHAFTALPGQPARALSVTVRN